MGRPIRVLIADDHAVVREGLAAILATQRDMQIVGLAVDGEDACMAFEQHRPDVLLLDLRMPKLDGVEVVKAICTKHRKVRIVIITVAGGDEDIFESLKAGAMAYLLKDASRQEILAAIRRVHAGQRYIPAEMAAKLAEHLARPQLTEREMDVLRGMVRGESNKEIGSALFISEGTIKTHVKSILAKLGAAGRTQAVAIAIRRGVVRV